MIRLLLAAAILIASAPLSPAKDNSAAQQQLDNAHKAADLFRNAVDPFELRLDFTAQLNAPTQGQFFLRWKSKDQWWSKVILGPFQQITIRNGEEEYTLRNAEFTPIAIGDLFNLLHLKDARTGFTAKKQSNNTEHGTALTCIQAQNVDFQKEAHVFCVDQTSHDVASEEWWTQDIKHREQYTDYADFEGLRYPRQLTLLDNGARTISVSVSKLESAVFDSALLVPPKGAIERRHCVGMKPAMPIKNPEPVFGTVDYVGAAAFSLTILTDGSVGDIHLIGRGGELMNDPAIETLRKWRFTPALCGTEPIVSDIRIVITVKHP